MRRHLLLCAGPDCVDTPEGEAAWTYLKKRIAELKLDCPPAGLFRTRCHCLRICTDGPILVVQPDGVWYGHATPERIERILQEHLLGGKLVTEYAFAHHPLAPSLATLSACPAHQLEPQDPPETAPG
jgi:(2Fe-2S) ferredoxin